MDSDEDIYAQVGFERFERLFNNEELDIKEEEDSIYTGKEHIEGETAQNELESIYEQNGANSLTASYHSANKATEPSLFTFLAAEKKLSYIGVDSESIPDDLINDFGLKTLILDISFNYISDLRDLQQFPYLEELICDNNKLNDATEFPKLESLKILSCNKNDIETLITFVDKIKDSFPNLTYLSMLGNKACPNQLSDQNKDEYDYSKYRKLVLTKLKGLKFLDCYEVTQQERDRIANEQMIYDVVTVKDDESNMTRKSYNESRPAKYTPLPQGSKAEELDPDQMQSSFGYCKYVYYGKQSEGNRFIRNDDL